jgi:hypothetical protein
VGVEQELQVDRSLVRIIRPDDLEQASRLGLE